MHRPYLYALPVLLLIILTILSSIPYTYSLKDSSRHMIIVAVEPVATGGYRGVSADLYVRVVCPGGGHVYVETSPLTHIDTQASARVAAMVASMVAGIDFTYCDYFVSIKASTPIIGGPSASAAMAVAFAAALLDLPLNSSVVMTGMVMPDGSIGPVGGVVEKLEAAAKCGAKLFLVPYGQIYAVKYVVEVRQGPNYVSKIVKPVLVDLRKLGEKLGVKVIQVASVFDALSIASNGVYRPPKTMSLREIASKYLLTVKPILHKWIEYEIEELKSVYNRITSLLRSYGVPLELSSIINELNRSMISAMTRGKELQSLDMLYAAACSYYQSIVYAKWLYYILELYIDPSRFANFVQHLNSSIAQILSEIRGYTYQRSIDLEHLAILLSAASRGYEALLNLEKARRSWSQRLLIETAQTLALADARAMTAQLWLKLLGAVPGRGIEIPINALSYISTALAGLARDTVSYVYVLGLGAGEGVSEAFRRFSMAMSSRNPIDRLALAIDAYSLAYSALVSTLLEERFDAVVGVLNTTCSQLATILHSRGSLPISTVLYMELATTLKSSPQSLGYILSKISIELATYLYMTLLIESSKSKELKTLTKASETTYRAPQTFTLTSTKTITTTITKTVTYTTAKTYSATTTLYITTPIVKTVTTTVTRVVTATSTQRALAIEDMGFIILLLMAIALLSLITVVRKAV